MTQELKDFSVAYMVIMIGIIVMVFAASYFFQYDMPGSTGFISSMIAALHAGQKYAQRNNAAPESGQSWKLAFHSFVAAMIISGLAVALFALIEGGGMIAAISAMPASSFAIAIAIIALSHVLAVRFFFSFGAKNLLKAIARAKSKEGNK